MFELLSIVITGRNQSVYLKEQFRQLKKLTITTELIYIDLASVDNSVAIAEQHTQNIFLIQKQKHLFRSAGRWVGSLASEFEWILYLDANQILSDNFIKYLNEKQHLGHGSQIAGIVGNYFLSTREELLSEVFLSDTYGSKFPYFRGAVLLHSDSVREAGGWNPSIFEFDGVELLTRLKRKGQNVLAIDIPMITQKEYKNSKDLKRLMPYDPRLWGFGQMWISHLLSGSLGKYFFMNPYPFLISFLSLSLLLYPNIISALGLVLVYSTIAILEGPNFIVTHTMEMVKALGGIFFYKFRKPSYKKIGF